MRSPRAYTGAYTGGKTRLFAGVSESRVLLSRPFRRAEPAWLSGSGLPGMPEMHRRVRTAVRTSN
jgi:hypothetical protein